MKRRFVTMDVFTDAVFGGNPLGVVIDADGLTTAQMQAITREFNYSETTFFLPPSDTANDAALRIFTPAREVPFAGHPNIGSALAAASLGDLFGRTVGDTLRFEEKAGLVTIALTRENGTAVFAELTAPAALELGETVSIATAAACAKLSPADIAVTSHAPIVASVGLPFTIAEVTSLSALQRAGFAAADMFEKLPGDAHDLMIYARTGEGCISARMFGPLEGVPEDPATGSACAALMGLLASLDPMTDGECQFDMTQGVEMGRPSRITATAVKHDGQVAEVRVGGAAITVFEGTFVL